MSGGGRYVWISGTSMASPARRRCRRARPRVPPELEPGAVAAAITRSATPLACPADWPAADERQCTGSATQSSFYGSGIANAAGATLK